MPAKISLSEFVAALQFGDPAGTGFLDRETGEILSGQEELEPVGPSTPSGDSQPSRTYERLPFLTDETELAFAREFVAAVQDPRDRQRLELALAGGDAREAFEMAVFRCQIANAWYQYRDRRLEQFAKDWLDARGLPYTDDVFHSAD